jgi:hypothetical protein
MSVERIERKGGAVWRVRWRDAQGRERSKVIGRKRDAEVFEAEVVRRKRTGDLDLLTGGRETLAEFAEEWWKLYAVPNLASRTLQSYAKLWDRHVGPRLGSMRLSAITPEVVERYRAELEADGVGLPTVHRALVQLQGVLRCAVEWRRIGNNPVKAVKKPKVRRYREVRPLPPLSVERLRIAAAGRRRTHGPRDATLIAVLAYAGIRPQEAQALRWSDVRERTLLIEKAADGQGGVKSTKTGQTRTVGCSRRSRPTWPSGVSAATTARTKTSCSRIAQAASGMTAPGSRGIGTLGMPHVPVRVSSMPARTTCGTASSPCLSTKVAAWSRSRVKPGTRQR